MEIYIVSKIQIEMNKRTEGCLWILVVIFVLLAILISMLLEGIGAAHGGVGPY